LLLLLLLSICGINTEICISLLYIDFNTYAGIGLADDWHIRIVKRRLKFAYQSDRRKTTAEKSEKRKRKRSRKERKLRGSVLVAIPLNVPRESELAREPECNVSLAALFSHTACRPQINAQPFFNRRCLATL